VNDRLGKALALGVLGLMGILVWRGARKPGQLAGANPSGKDLWLARLKKKHDTVADLKKEIAVSKAAIAKHSKKKRKVTDPGYGDGCRLIEHQWNQIRDREQAIAAFTKTPDANTPRPTVCPPPMVLQYQDEPPESEADREYGWAFMDPEDKRPAKPAGYDERVRARAEHKRLADEEWKAYKARGLWGPDMLKTIAAESRSPKEFARRAEAWASTEAKPPSITMMVKAYRGDPGKLAKLIREARTARESGARQRFEALISSHEGDDLDGTKLDKKMTKASLREEREAIRVYGQRLKKTRNPALKKALRHARKEEREHAASFARVLRR
jgi:hypothetical protein